jgi:hypothetical protein
MATGFGAINTETKPPQAESKEIRPAAGKPPRSPGTRKRRQDQTGKAASGARYFLAAGVDSHGKPDFDRELSNEAEAIVESFLAGRHYYKVTEWRTSADTGGALPTIRKEAVTTGKDS